MVDDSSSFAEELEQYLDKISYDAPRPGDLRAGVIVSVSQQGVIIDLGLKRDGLVPPSDLQQLSSEERGALRVDDEVTVSVVSTRDQESLLVSIYKARVVEDWEKAESLKESGEVLEVLIDGYNKGGLVAPFGRLRGFIPMSHLSGFSRGLEEREKQRRLAKLRGETIAIKIIEVDRERQRLVMSQREGRKKWEEARKREFLETLQPGDVLQGRVRSLQAFGAFVDLGPADGLVHISELAWYRVGHPREVLKVGEEIDVKVLRVDPERMRISLSRKPLIANPWSTVEDRYAIGQLVEGRVVRITDYGAFVQVEPGIEGLLHLSQLSRTQVQHPSEIVADGETHLLRVISIQPQRQRIGLSLKQVSYQEQIDWMTAQQEKAAAEAEAAAAAAQAEADAAQAAAASAEPEANAPEAVAEVTEPVAESAPADTESDASEAVAEAAETIEEDASDAPAEESAGEAASTEEVEAPATDEVEAEPEAPAEAPAEESTSEAPAAEEASDNVEAPAAEQEAAPATDEAVAEPEAPVEEPTSEAPAAEEASDNAEAPATEEEAPATDE